MGWLVGICFVIIWLTLLLRLFRSGVQVTIDENGITDRRLGSELISWDQISSISLEKATLEAAFAIDVFDPSEIIPTLRFHQKLRSRWRTLRKKPVVIVSLLCMKPGLTEAMEWIERNIPEIIQAVEEDDL